MFRALIITAVLTLASPVCLAQFSGGSLPDTGFAWRLSGDLVRGEGGPPIEADDEIGAFFEGELVGFTRISAAQASNSEYNSLIIIGDNPDTGAVQEGPVLGSPITLRYYDASTNTTLTDVRALNTNGEAVNLTWQGGEAIPAEIPLPPELRFQSATFDIRVGGGTDGGGGGGNGGGQTPTGNPDVDGDGRVTKADAAMVLRIVTGGARTLDQATIARADVNGDGTVSTDDAVAVLKAQ